MFKKIIALLLSIVMLGLLLVSCGKGDVPDGMQAAYLEGEPFRLYVPESWSVNTKSGVSSAYSYANDTMIVSARYSTPSDPEQSVDDYLLSLAEGYAKTMKDFVLISRENAVLGGEDAKRMEYTVTENGQGYTCVQYVTRYDGHMISLCFYCLTDRKDAAAEDFKAIREAFVLCPMQAPTNDEVVDEKTPDGMKIASAKSEAHRLYVPKSWICHSESGKSEAYCDESGKPNVTVTIYVPDDSMTVDEYVEICKGRYSESLAGYQPLDLSERQVAGRRAVSMTYRASYDGVDFCVMQTVLSDGQAMYSVTYTALADRFDAHLADVESILNAFSFR